MSLDVNQVQSVFLAAIEAGAPSRRASVLDRRCGDNLELRRRVEALLKAHDEPEDLPGIEAGLMTADEPTLSYSPGAVIAGRYELVELIAEGGMGTVWVAQQSVPIRRIVALSSGA